MWLVDHLDVFELCARIGHQVELDALEPLRHDLKARAGEQVVYVRDAARDGVLHRDHGEVANGPNRAASNAASKVAQG